jgi:membrane protein
MHKIINKKSIQKITAIIIIMIMCNFIMSGKVWAVESWMSIKEYQDLSIGGTDTKQDLYNKDTSPAVKKLCSAWNITAEQAIEMLKNHANDEKTLYVNKETYDNTAYTISDVKIKPTEEEKTNYNIQVDDDGYASVDTSYNYGVNSDLEGSTKDGIGGLLLSPIAALIQGIGDGVNYLLQRNIIGDKSDVFLNSGVFEHSKMIQVLNENKPVSGVPQVDIAEEYIETATGKYGIPNIKLTPAEIFAGNVSALDANFFKTEGDHNQELGGSEKSIVEQLRDTVATWYVALRNIAIVGLLSALLYIGIRIVISSSAGDKAKYKQFFVDWVVALCLIFFLHYIMAFTMTMSETVTDVLAGDRTNQGRIKEVNIRLTETDGTTTFKDAGTEVCFSSNFTGVARMKADYQGGTLKIGYSILYIALTVYTVYFAFVYLKRLLMLAFFTMIAPLVALTYPLDKIRDGKAQAFNYWFKEYMFYALLQPMHMLLYTVFVSSALSVAANNLLYAIVALAFIVPAEKIVKQMFGIKGNTESTLGGFAGGALASQAFNMLRKGPPQPKKGGGDGPKGEKGIRLDNPNKPNAMDTLAGDAMENGVENAAQTATAAGIGAAAGAASANATGNENNEETDSNGVHVSDDGVIDGVQFREVPDNEQQGNGLENPEMQSGENPAMPENGQQNQNADNNNSEENPFAAIRAKANSAKGNLGSAINSRVQSAGGWSGIAKGVGKTGAKLAGRAAMMTTMGALGLGVGIVGGDMSDTLKGLGAGLTAGYATGGRLNSAVGNTIVGNNAAGRFLDDAIRGTGPERKRNDYIRSYMSNQENRNRLIEKNPSIKKSELDAQLRQRAELSYDSGVTDAKMLDRAVKLQKQLDAKNPRGVGNAERHGANYNKTVATMQLASKYSDSTFENDEKIAKAQNRLASKLERNMSERTNGPIDADTAKKYKARAKAEAAETMGNIDYLKNG